MGYHKVCQTIHNRNSRREEREMETKNVSEEIIAENILLLKKEIYPYTGSTEGPK